MDKIELIRDSEGFVRFFGKLEKLDDVYVSIDVYEAVSYSSDGTKEILEAEKVLKTFLKWDGSFNISTECAGEYLVIDSIIEYCEMIRAVYNYAKTLLDGLQ